MSKQRLCCLPIRHRKATQIKFLFQTREKFSIGIRISELFNSRRASETREWRRKPTMSAFFPPIIGYSKRHSSRTHFCIRRWCLSVVKWSLHHVARIKFLTISCRSVYESRCANERRFLGHIAGWQISNACEEKWRLFTSPNVLLFVRRIWVGKKKFFSLEWRWLFFWFRAETKDETVLQLLRELESSKHRKRP